MPSKKNTHKKQNQTKSSLKTLQADLTESKNNYNHQENNLNQLKIQVDHLKQIDKQGAKVVPITFKKSKSSHNSQNTHSKA